MADHKLSAVLELKDRYSHAVKKAGTATVSFDKINTSAVKNIEKEWSKGSSAVTKLGTAAFKAVGKSATEETKKALGGFKALEKGASQAATVIGRNKSAFSQFVGNAGKAGTKAGNALKNNIVKSAKGIPGAVGGILKGLGGGIATGLGLGIFQSVAGAVSSGVGAAKNTVVGGFNDFVELEDKLVRNAALMGINKTKAKEMSTQVRELGASTEYTSAQVADVHKYFAMAGWDADNIKTVTAPTLMFASATGQDLGSSADIVSDYLTAFNMKAEEANYLMDVMATTALKSNTNIGMIGESFKGMAGINAGRDTIEELGVITGLLANQGTKGGDTGTFYKSTVLRLTSGSKEVRDALGKLGATTYKKIDGKKIRKSTLEIFEDVAKGMEKLDAQGQDEVLSKLFGIHHAGTAKKLINGLYSEDYPRLRKELENTEGATKRMYEQWSSDSPKYKIAMLSSAWAGFRERLGQAVAPTALQYIEKLTDYLGGNTFSTEKIEEYFKKAKGYTYDFIQVVEQAAAGIKAIGKGLGIIWNAGEKVGEVYATLRYGADVVKQQKEKKELARLRATDEEKYKETMDAKISSGELYKMNRYGVLGGGKVDARDVATGKVKGATDTEAAQRRILVAYREIQEYMKWLEKNDPSRLEKHAYHPTAQKYLNDTEHKNNFGPRNQIGQNILSSNFSKGLSAPPVQQGQEPAKGVIEHDVKLDPLQINLNIKKELADSTIEGILNKRFNMFKADLNNDIINAYMTQS